MIANRLGPETLVDRDIRLQDCGEREVAGASEDTCEEREANMIGWSRIGRGKHERKDLYKYRIRPDPFSEADEAR